MLRIGDWIQLPNGVANGTVEEITLNTVKIRNWDETISTVPPYTLVNNSFQNWRGMQELSLIHIYQQRWNAHDQEDAPLVRDLLGEVKDESLRQQLFELFRIEPMLGKKVILLSSGELRKFQLTKTLLTAPRVLIMDNPFIGLDAATRELLYLSLIHILDWIRVYVNKQYKGTAAPAVKY